ncbi:MAG: spore maturation protein, partial [Clostridia bacterium]|nr:spore maturation protein [Clostridia bacterium]
TKILSKILSPIINLIFGKNTLSSESKQLVSMNMSANILGMNGAATPLGIKAIESMGKNETKATFPMIMLTVISCTSIQILPTSIMGLMSASGSKNPSSIILPSILAGLLSTIIAIVLTKLIHKITSKKVKK